MKRRNILIIVIIAFLIVGVAVGFTFYEQSLVKQRLAEANDLHTQFMNANIKMENNTNLKIAYDQYQKDLTILQNELNTLRTVSGTIFATQAQKDYINAAIQVNTDNTKSAELQKKGIEYINQGQLSNAAQIGNEMKTMGDEATKAANTRDSIIAAHPEEFGFDVVKF